MDFLLAVSQNNVDKVRQILQTGIDVNSPILWNAKDTYSPVLPATASARPELRERLQSGQEYHSRALNIAVLGGHADMCRLLLSAGADINVKDGRGRTALICAIYGLDLDVANINTTNLPLISKTHEAHYDIMKNILLRHPNLFVSTLDAPQFEIKGITPLCLASYLSKTDVIQLLLEDGRINVDGTDSKSATALMYAARDGNLPIVKLLLNYHASPDITDNHGWSAIQYAGRSPEIVQLYEEALRCRRHELAHLHGQTPLAKHTMTNYTKLSHLISSLPEYPSSLTHVQFKTLRDIDLMDPTAAPITQILQNAFLQAIKRHDHATLRTLLLWSPPLHKDQRPLSGPLLVNFHDPKTGMTALHHAMRTKPLPSLDTIVLLYQAGIDINSQTYYGRTALHHLARFGLDKDGKSWAIQKSNKDQKSQPPPQQSSQQTSQQRALPSHPMRMNSISSMASSVADAAPTSPPPPLSPTVEHNDADLSRYSVQSAESATSASSNNTPDASWKSIMAAPTVPQHLAAAASLLIRLGALVNIADPNGNTPLHFAAEFGGVPEVLEVLIMENADLTLKNKKGLTPLDVCKNEDIRKRMFQLDHERKMSIKTKSSVSYMSAGGSNVKPFENAGDYRSSASLSRSVSRSTLRTDANGSSNSSKWLSQPSSATSLQGSDEEDDEGDMDLEFQKILKAFFSYQTTFTDNIESALAKITDSILNTTSFPVEETITRLRLELRQAHDMFDATDQRAERVMMHYRQELEQVEQIHQADWDMSDLQCDKIDKLFDVFERIDGRFGQLELDQDELVEQVESLRRAAARQQPSQVTDPADLQEGVTNLIQSLLILDTVSVDAVLYSREDRKRLCGDMARTVEMVLCSLKSKEGDEAKSAREDIEAKWNAVRQLLSKEMDPAQLAKSTPATISATVQGPAQWERQMTAARLYGQKDHHISLNTLELNFEILHSNLCEVQKDLDTINQRVAQVFANKRAMYDQCLKLEGELQSGARPEPVVRSELEAVLTSTQKLFDEQKELETERTALRKELVSLEKELDGVRAKVRETRPPVLLQGLLERLETEPMPLVKIEKDWKEDANLVMEVFEDDSSMTTSSSRTSSIHEELPFLSSLSPLALQCVVTRLDASLYALKVLAKSHIGRSRQTLLEVSTALTQANAELEETRSQMTALYDEAAEVAHQVFTLKTELETIVQHRKEEIVKVWEVVDEVSEGVNQQQQQQQPKPPSQEGQNETPKSEERVEDQDRHQWIIRELEQLQNVNESLQEAIEDLQREQDEIGQKLRRLATALIEPQVNCLVGQDEGSLLTISDRLSELMDRVRHKGFGLSGHNTSDRNPLPSSSSSAAPADSRRFSVATQNSMRSSIAPRSVPRPQPHARMSTATRASQRMSVMSTASFTSLSSYQQDRMLARASTLSSAFSRSQHSLIQSKR